MTCIQCGRAFRGRGRQEYCPSCKPEPAPVLERSCPICGTGFTPVKASHLYCSRKCRDQSYADKQRGKTRPADVRSCRVCGAQFEAHRLRVYCSYTCQRAWNRQRHTAEGKDRELTELSVFLAHKYSFEGMSLKEIAGILNRSPEGVRRALERPISQAQLWSLHHYAKTPKGKKGTSQCI